MSNELQPPPDRPYLMLWFIISIVFFIIAFIYALNWAKVEPEKADFSSKYYYLEYQFQYYKEGNQIALSIVEESILPQAPPYLIKGEVYGDLVDCLVYYESKGYKWATGKAGEKGILQFMPKTFQHYCVGIYGYRNDIWSEEIQRDCCAEMIADGRLSHWTTRKFCK